MANRQLRRLLAAALATSAGEFGVLVALSVYAYIEGGAALVGLVAAVQTVPAVLAASAATLLMSDRLSRRRLLLVTNVLRGDRGGHRARRGREPRGLARDRPGRSPRRRLDSQPTRARGAHDEHLARRPAELSAANALLSSVNNLGFMIGCGLGGLLVAATDPQTVFWLCALAYLVGAGIIASLPTPAGANAPGAVPVTARPGDGRPPCGLRQPGAACGLRPDRGPLGGRRDARGARRRRPDPGPRSRHERHRLPQRRLRRRRPGDRRSRSRPAASRRPGGDAARRLPRARPAGRRGQPRAAGGRCDRCLGLRRSGLLAGQEQRSDARAAVEHRARHAPRPRRPRDHAHRVRRAGVDRRSAADRGGRGRATLAAAGLLLPIVGLASRSALRIGEEPPANADLLPADPICTPPHAIDPATREAVRGG